MPQLDDFIARWSGSHGSERANSQRFLTELILALDLPPMPTAAADAPAYEFEHQVPYKDDGGTVHDLRIDLYKRGCFVLESKQGMEIRDRTSLEQIVATPAKAGTRRGTSAWDRLMDRAFHQAEGYVRRLPASEGRPPFIIVLDVAFAFDLYAEFSCTGGLYAPFPAPGANRFFLADLARPEVAAMLTAIWTDPLSLDPARRSAKVTRDIAAHLAELAKSLEIDHAPEDVAAFLMRCLFTMFAEDVGLLPDGCFQHILEDSQDRPDGFAPMAEELWRAMNVGGWSVAVRNKLLRFNGGIFADPHALNLDHDQIAVLLKAAKADWREVEPAIFGTLLERALNPR
ncbi:MAG: class I SAM-dependent DNA methyltransferase, partial [Deltaproteobacteria bacterium]|nr:class I SAM-dependent DNA methyltransferase [Deltaproteobacteria bacterium]